MWWDSDHSDGHQWIAGPPAPGPIPGTNGNTNSFYGPFPEYVVTYRRFWQRMDPQLIMAGRGPVAGYVMVTQGMSITVSDETTLQKTWNLPAGESGKNTVFILWQLVDEIVGLQSDGSVVGGWSRDTCGANINLPIPPELAAMGMGAPRPPTAPRRSRPRG